MRDLRVAEVVREVVTIENGAASSFRVRLAISFKYETGERPFAFGAVGHYAESMVPYEPGKREVRASDADREATVERLRVAGMEGRLDHDELEERIESAYAARWCGELEALTLDITPPPARLHPMAPAFVRPSRRPNGLAIASVVVGVLWMGWLGSVAAVVMGHIALRQIERSGGMRKLRPLPWSTTSNAPSSARGAVLPKCSKRSRPSVQPRALAPAIAASIIGVGPHT